MKKILSSFLVVFFGVATSCSDPKNLDPDPTTTSIHNSLKMEAGNDGISQHKSIKIIASLFEDLNNKLSSKKIHIISKDKAGLKEEINNAKSKEEIYSILNKNVIGYKSLLDFHNYYSEQLLILKKDFPHFEGNGLALAINKAVYAELEARQKNKNKSVRIGDTCQGTCSEGLNIALASASQELAVTMGGCLIMGLSGIGAFAATACTISSVLVYATQYETAIQTFDSCLGGCVN
jgi:hypothetical protein